MSARTGSVTMKALDRSRRVISGAIWAMAPLPKYPVWYQENPGLLEDLDIVVEPVEGTSEVKLTAEQYEALEDAVPELAEAVKNDVRRGSKRMTTREVGETLKKKAEKPAWRTAEVDGITKELELRDRKSVV